MSVLINKNEKLWNEETKCKKELKIKRSIRIFVWTFCVRIQCYSHRRLGIKSTVFYYWKTNTACICWFCFDRRTRSRASRWLSHNRICLRTLTSTYKTCERVMSKTWLSHHINLDIFILKIKYLMNCVMFIICFSMVNCTCRRRVKASESKDQTVFRGLYCVLKLRVFCRFFCRFS